MITDILNMKEKIIQQEKYSGIKHQRNFQLLHDSPMHDSPQSVGCALLTVTPLDHETRMYVEVPTLAVHKVAPICSRKNHAAL